MKRNLCMSIALLFLAVITCCGVTFAYFSSTQTGSDNYIKLGDFTFKVTSNELLSQTSSINFKAPTIINIDKISAGNLAFNTDGDDEYFNNYIVPFSITIENTSAISMRIVNITVTTSACTTGKTDYSSCLMSFIFDSTTVTTSGYAETLRPLCAPFTTTATSLFDKTKEKISQKNKPTDPTIKSELDKIKLKELKSGAGSALTFNGIAWLDYRPYKTVIGSNRLDGAINIKVSVEVEQFDKGATI